MILPLKETSEGTLSLEAFKKLKVFIKNIDVVTIGPGLSQNNSTLALARKVIVTTDKRMVIDADGLNALVGHLDILREPRTENLEPVLTPHPGEMARLLGMSISHVQSKRVAVTQSFAKVHKVTAILKGHNTVVADYKNN